MKYETEKMLFAAFSVFGIGLVSVVMLWAVYLFLWIAPHAFANDAACLERGYPKASTTWTGKGYCVTVEGVLTPVVKEIE